MTTVSGHSKMGQSKPAIPEIQQRRALTPPLPPPPRITDEYIRKKLIYLQEASPLFKLPQQLRDELYRYVLLTPWIRVIHDLVTNDRYTNPHGTFCVDGWIMIKDAPKILGLLRSCRRVYAEAMDIFYGETKLYFPEGEDLFQLIETLPPAQSEHNSGYHA